MKAFELLLTIVHTGGNYWEEYGRSRAHWPGKQKAQGLWSSLSFFTPELLLPFQDAVRAGGF